jgi:hypothetical protein
MRKLKTDNHITRTLLEESGQLGSGAREQVGVDSIEEQEEG